MGNAKSYIEMQITTCDKDGNKVTVIEKRITRERPPTPPGKDLENPVVTGKAYCKLFASLLIKQEFTPDEVIKEFRNFFIETDKENLS